MVFTNIRVYGMDAFDDMPLIHVYKVNLYIYVYNYKHTGLCINPNGKKIQNSNVQIATVGRACV